MYDQQNENNSRDGTHLLEEAERDICEEDIDNFLANEQPNSQGQNDYTIDQKMIPEIGMQFKTRDEAQNFFNMYAYAARFSISIVSSCRTTSRKGKGRL